MGVVIPDLSRWDSVTDWPELKEECPFIIFKGTQRCDLIDWKAEEYIENCERYKIPYWIYTFLEATGRSETEQCKFLVRSFKGKVGDMFCGWCLDVESGNSDPDILAALKWTEGSGKPKVLLYTMHAQMKTLESSISYAKRKSKIAWWEARYGKNNGQYSSDFPPHAGVDLHQFTDKGKVRAINGNKKSVDLNRLTGTLPLEWFTETVAMRRKG